MAVTISIDRADGTTLVIDDADWLAEAFFVLDPSSQPGGYDDWIVSPHQRRDRITSDDITAINRSMSARSSPVVWEQDLNQTGDWLADLGQSWALFDMDDRTFAELARPRLTTCIQHLISKGRGVSVATKVLHIKRPELIPVCDRLVVQQLALPAPTSGASASGVIDEIRVQGRKNLGQLRIVQTHLEGVGLSRSLVRILDGLLWASHPSTRIYPVIGMIRRWRRGR